MPKRSCKSLAEFIFNSLNGNQKVAKQGGMDRAVSRCISTEAASLVTLHDPRYDLRKWSGTTGFEPPPLAPKFGVSWDRHMRGGECHLDLFFHFAVTETLDQTMLFRSVIGDFLGQ
jgi:hypothetical protein